MAGFAFLVMTLGWGTASAVELDARGWIESDLRFRVSDVPAGGWYAPTGMKKGIDRFQNRVGGNAYVQGRSWSASVEGEVVLWAGSDASTLPHLSDRRKAETITWEMDEAAIELWDVGLPGLDFKIGHQVVQWGMADQFNPTNTLNPENLQDPLKFGEQLPNTMIRADYAIGNTWTLSGVLVPVFRPATLPPSSVIGVSFTDRMPVLEDEVRRRLQSDQQTAFDAGYPTIVDETHVIQPDPSIDNMAFMARLGGAVGMTDIALSWYTGRTDMPQPVGNYSTLGESPRCHPVRTDDCISGYVLTDASLAYPRMHVAGFNAAGELNVLAPLGGQPLGWRVEVAWVMPEKTAIALRNSRLELPISHPAGEYDYDLNGERPTVVSSKPYAKWTLGLDYTIGKSVYLNTQWVHGMADEFGYGDFLNEDRVTRAGGGGWEIRRYRLGDYLVLGTDVRLATTTFRLFSLFDLSGYQKETTTTADGKPSITQYSPFSPKGFSAVLFPEVMVNLGDGLNLSVGTIQLFGKSYTKFGDPAAGGDLVFTKIRYDF